jgi:hypothetical protein
MPPDAEQRLESERLILRPIAKEVAASILAGGMPDGMKFAEGYPDEFSVEVMDLVAGKRQDEDPGFAPLFIILKEEDAVIGEISASWKAGKPPRRLVTTSCSRESARVSQPKPFGSS